MFSTPRIFSALAAATTVVSLAAPSAPRYALYFDQYHTDVLPNNTLTEGITHVITAFANSSLFSSEPVGTYQPFMNLTDIREMFDNGTKVCMAIGGWGDAEGFRAGLSTNASRHQYAANIATTLDTLGYDCIDMDYEYPGGNGYDYKQVPNSELVSEIDTFPLLLESIKTAIGTKELSVAIPALERDMIAYTADKISAMETAVDYFNIMSYDLMNRRDTATKHHSDVMGSLNTIETYIDRGMTPSKMTLGIAFYAKYFTLPSNSTCTGPIGCPIVLAETADGQDAGTSGAMTFEASSFPVVVDSADLTPSTDGSCGNTFTCAGTSDTCCSQYGYCGNTDAHCGTGCQPDFSTDCANADVKTTAQSFADAMTNGQTDTERGGQWYVDSDTHLFWTWDTAELIAEKFDKIVSAKGLAGVMAWSLAEDSYDWSRLKAMQDGVKGLSVAKKPRKVRRSVQHY